MLITVQSCAYVTFAQSTTTLMGARAFGIARTSSCISDEWAIFNNVGGLAKVELPIAAFTHEINPTFAPFSRTAALIAVPLPYGVAGASLFRFGDELYSEQIISLAFSNAFGIASLGIKVNYIQYRADGFGSKGVLSVGFGGITRLTKKLLIGTSITNINQPKISNTDREHLPTILTAGIGLNASETIFITTEIEKDLDHHAAWKTGVEYSVNKKFKARTGFNVNPDAFFVGIGFVSRRFKLDYAFQYDPGLGSSHQASVGYTFRKKT